MKESNDDLRPKEVRRRHTLLMIAGLISVPFILLVVFSIAINFRTFWPVEPIISTETTVITGPLKSDGRQVDYFAAIEGMYYTPEMKTEANGFRTLVATYGAEPFLVYLDPETKAFLCEQLYEKLGLRPVRDPKPFIVDPYNFLTKHAEENGLDAKELTDLYLSDWEPSQLPMLEEWLKEADPVLDLFSRELGKDMFCIPLVRENECGGMFGYSGILYSIRSNIAYKFHDRIKLRLEKGDIDGAIEDHISCMRLGRFLRRHPEINPAWLDGHFAERFAFHCPIGTETHVPNSSQIDRLREGIASLPEPLDISDLKEVFRYEVLDHIQNLRDGKGEQTENVSGPLFYMDWNLVMRDYNEKYDKYHTDWNRYLEQLPRKNILNLLSPLSRAELKTNEIAGEYAMDYAYFRNFFEHRTSCSYNVLDIALAMLLYKEKHGTLPPAWTVDENGRPLHSWRVLILPYLGQKELYEKIRLEEPWDSEHNSLFHKTEIAQYRCGYMDPPPSPGETPYAIVFGENLAFDGTGKGKRLSELGPKSDKMALVVERKTTVNWMRPEKEIAKSDIRPEIVSSVFDEWAKAGFINGTVTTFGTEPCEDFLAELEGKGR